MGQGNHDYQEREEKRRVPEEALTDALGQVEVQQTEALHSASALDCREQGLLPDEGLDGLDALYQLKNLLEPGVSGLANSETKKDEESAERDLEEEEEEEEEQTVERSGANLDEEPLTRK